MARRFDKIYRPIGLTSGQFSLIISLNRPAPASFAGVARLLSMDRTTLTAALKPLVRRGLVDISVDPDDRRAKRLALTDEGRAVLAQAVPLWERVHAEIETGLGSGDRVRGDLRILDGSVA